MRWWLLIVSLVFFVHADKAQVTEQILFPQGFIVSYPLAIKNGMAKPAVWHFYPNLAAETINLSKPLAPLYDYPGTRPPLGIPAFLWGFVLSAPGMGIVYLHTDDRLATRSAFVGAVAQAVVLGSVFFIAANRH